MAGGELVMSGQPRLRIGIALRTAAFGDGVGGMERAAALHLTAIAQSGVDVRLYTPAKLMSGTLPEGVELVDVPWPRWNRGPGVPIFGLAYSRWVGDLARALASDEKRLDLIHLHGGAAGVLPRLSPEVISVVNPHGMEEFEPASIARLPNRMLTRRLSREGRHANRVIATDERLVDAVEHNIGVARQKITVIPNSVDLDALRRLSIERREGDPFTIVSVGRLVRNKGYDLLLAALKQRGVRSALPRTYRWVHFGSGASANALIIEAASDPVIPLEVRTARSDSDVQGSLSRADVFVQPSRHEGSSLTTLEAMAHGRVIVATAVGGIPDKIRDGDTGYLAHPTADSIGDAIKRAIASDGLVGRNARELVVAKFGIDATTASYLALYEALLPHAGQVVT